MSDEGLFVVVEGIEGAGKTTQVAMLAERLRRAGIEPVVVREPGGTPFAEEVRQVLLHGEHDLGAAQEVFLFQAARADLVARVIRPALASGRVVIADRFELSTRAYQAAGGGLPAELVRAAIELATGGLKPHLYVILDATPATGRSRQAAEGKSPDRLERRREEYHEAVARAFRSAAGPGIVHVEAEQPAESTHRAIWSVLASRFPQTFAPAAG